MILDHLTPDAAPPFRVRLWCRDCTGQDPQGCFDGGTELLTEDDPPFAVAEFATLREAVDAGHAAAPDGPLEFDVLDALDEEIEYGCMTETEIDSFGIVTEAVAPCSSKS